MNFFEDNSVKGIFLLNVFYHINEPEKFLKQVNRVLKIIKADN